MKPAEIRREFASVEALAAEYPDLAPAARELLAEAPPGASPLGFRVVVCPLGVGDVGGFENALVELRLTPEASEPVQTSRSIGRPVLRRRQVGALDDLLHLSALGGAPNGIDLAHEVARQAYEAALVHGRRVETFKATFADRPPPWDRWHEFMGVVMGALANAYRAGRFMREAELGALVQPTLDAEKARRHNGGAATASKADEWRGPALKYARKARGKNPTLSQGDLADLIVQRLAASLPGLPGRDHIKNQISKWEKVYSQTGGNDGLQPRQPPSSS